MLLHFAFYRGAAHGQVLEGPAEATQQVALEGVQVSSGDFRGVWSRHNLTTKHERLLNLEQTVAKRRIKLSDEQTRLLQKFSLEYRERHIETYNI